MKNVCCGLSSRAIAKQEGVYYSSVDKSIAAAKKNFIKFYENLWFWVCISDPFVQMSEWEKDRKTLIYGQVDYMYGEAL